MELCCERRQERERERVRNVSIWWNMRWWSKQCLRGSLCVLISLCVNLQWQMLESRWNALGTWDCSPRGVTLQLRPQSHHYLRGAVSSLEVMFWKEWCFYARLWTSLSPGLSLGHAHPRDVMIRSDSGVAPDDLRTGITDFNHFKTCKHLHWMKN